MQPRNSSMRKPHGSGPSDGCAIHLPLNSMIQSISRAPESMIMHSRLMAVTSGLAPSLSTRNLKRILFHACDALPLFPITRSKLGTLYILCVDRAHRDESVTREALLWASLRAGSDQKIPRRLHRRIPTLNAMHTSRSCFLHIANAER